ncbi:MAG: class I SAM-dependent methyltransferase [Bacteroidota bacterium]
MSYIKEQENSVSGAFSAQSPKFDTITNTNPMEVMYRTITRAHVLNYVKAEQHMLELNCGTGLDAFFFAEAGLKVHATDNADGMLEQLALKLATSPLKNVTYEKCSFNELDQLKTTQQFDHAFSNFGGLNCAGDIQAVVKQLDAHMKPGGMAHFVFIAPVCLWEWATIFKGKYKFAFRRLTKKGLRSHLEGHYFDTYYYSPNTIKNAFGNHYELVQLRSLGCFMPPTFNDYFPAKYPKIFNALKKMELAVNTAWPFNRTGDMFIISVRKKN